MHPSVSVVIPAYNSGRWIAQAIESVLSQTAAVSQIIVVDDGSTDDTPQQLAPYRKHVHYLHQKNQGVAGARNAGIQRANGDLIAFLDADDIWHPLKLEGQLRVLRANPDLGLLGTATFSWPAKFIPPIAPQPADALLRIAWDRLILKNHFTTSSILVRRAVLERAGEFDTALRGSEDYDLWLRMAEIAPVAVLRLPLTGYRVVPSSLSRKPQLMEAGLRRVLLKLKQRGAFRRRWMLQRKACSYLHHACAFNYTAVGDHRTAALRMVQSFLEYPLPYRRDEVFESLERIKRFAVIMLRMIGARPHHPYVTPSPDDVPVVNDSCLGG